MTGARVLRDIQSENHPKLRSYQWRYCESMGDSAALERKSMDVIRSFYSEASLVTGEWIPDLENIIVKYLISYVGSQEDLLINLPNLSMAVNKVLDLHQLPEGFWDGILDLFVNNHDVASKLLPIFFDKPIAKASAFVFLNVFGEVEQSAKSSYEIFLRYWEDARKNRLREYYNRSSDLKLLKLVRLATADVETLCKILKKHNGKWLCSLDSTRITRMVELAEILDQFCRQKTFEERERALSLADNLAETLLRDFEENPTRFAVGDLHPLLENIREQIKDANNDLLQQAQPKISVRLSIDTVYPDKDNLILLHIAVENGDGCSPVNNIELKVHSQRPLFHPMEEVYRLPESIRGGESLTIPCDIRVSKEATEMKVISVEVSLSYIDRHNNRINGEAEKLSLRLYPASEFKKINNPFALFAQGSVVDDEKMFVGREEVLDHIIKTLGNARAKCFVLYGQKRAGKSSVLHHLGLRLNKSGDFLCVNFSIGDIIADFSVHSFLYRILQELNNSLVRLYDEGQMVPSFIFPSYEDFQTGALPKFIQIFQDFGRACKNLPTWSNRRIVITIDEFSYLYSAIKKKQISEEFMKTWKALLERQLFSAVLVGQDVMPKFKKEYSNEFGVTQDERLTYLTDLNTRKLIEDPIRIDGVNRESRFRGNAIERVLELTSGSPFYLQILCDRLIKHMNGTQSMYATEVEVDKAADDLIYGNNALQISDFDNLVTAGDADVVAIPAKETLAVLQTVAEGTQFGTCHRNSLDVPQTNRLTEIIKDLLLREVLAEPKTDYYKIRVGLFRNWLLAHPQNR